jgi:endonuclease III
MNEKAYFLEIYKKARKKYGGDNKRLAAEDWGADWKTLIATIMSAQSRDETTIPIAENLFRKYTSLRKLANARVSDVKKIFKSLNYNNTKARNVVLAAKYILEEFNGKIPEDLEDLIKIPGVGRKTANLVLGEVYGKEAICVDTHVHRISNVLGLVKTKTPNGTELALQRIVPKKYWNKINRLFVLWGKEVPGMCKERLLERLEGK